MKIHSHPAALAATLMIAMLACERLPHARGQITTPVAPASVVLPDRTTTLRDQLINRLRATTPSQQTFIRAVVAQVAVGRLDAGRVIAIERYARRRAGHYPFPTFERAVRFDANRLGVPLPSVELTRRSRVPIAR